MASSGSPYPISTGSASRFLWSLANQFDGVIAAACPSIQNKRLDFCTHDQHHFAICDGITMRRLSVESNTILRMLMLAHRRAAGRSTTHFYEYPLLMQGSIAV